MTKAEISKVYSKKDTSCSCDECKSACQHKPGWFLPDEIKGVATFLGLSIQQLFKTKLAVDWWEGEEDIFLLAPSLKSSESGTEYPGDPRGECIFYKDELCEIYSVRPFECRKYKHDEAKTKRHEAVALAWKKSQKRITNLLGRTPEASTFHGSGLFGMLFNP